MQEIKFCQYCGENKRLEPMIPNLKRWCVICGNCGARGPQADDRELAIQKWNRRIQEAPEMPQEMPNIQSYNFAKEYTCPIMKCKCNGQGCMMWVSVGEDKGRCGLVNTMFINSTGCGV